MSDDRLLIEIKKQQYKTNHVLHLLLSIFTVGLWIPIWIIVGLSNSIEKKKLDHKITKIEEPDRISSGSILLITIAIFSLFLGIIWMVGGL